MTRMVLFTSTLLLAGTALAQDPPSRVARLNHLEGAVSFQPATVDRWTEATLNYPLTIGDHLYTDEGARAEMHIGSTSIRLNSHTNMSFLNLDDRTVQIQLTEGAVDLRIRHLDDSELYEIDTPNGAISLLRTGEYRIDTDPERNATMVTVRTGEAEVTANGASFPIHPQQTAYFTAGDGATQDVRSANPPDSFDQFCQQRDRREDSLPPPRYVSRDMAGYEDLEANGVWQTYPEYGAVWVPRVEAGWAPYRFGHWAWVEPWGWTWIDNAPWGFAPFHYGRWAFVAGTWGWIPGPLAARPVYAPALVAFVGGNNWSVSLRIGGGGVAWFPLGPREVYQPAYHVSPAYVNRVNVTNITNITNVNVTNINRTNVTNVRYVNQTVPGAVTAVSREDFVSARPVHRSAVVVPPAAVASAPVTGMSAPVAPRQQSILARAESRPVPQPRAAVIQRQVFTKTAPPPPPVPFAAKQQALQANPGRPVDPATLRTLRANAPAAPQTRPVAPTSGYQQPMQPPARVIQPPVQQQNRPAQIPEAVHPPRPNTPAPPITPLSRPPDTELNRERQLHNQQQPQQQRQEVNRENREERKAAPEAKPHAKEEKRTEEKHPPDR